MALHGELDLASSPLLQALVDTIDGRPSWLMLDLSDLEFCDVSGLSALLAVQQHLARRGASLVLANPQPIMARVLAITGLDHHFTITATAGSAGN